MNCRDDSRDEAARIYGLRRCKGCGLGSTEVARRDRFDAMAVRGRGDIGVICDGWAWLGFINGDDREDRRWQ
jgi:hypothetical protein